MGPVLEVGLLGGFHLRYAGEPVTDLTSLRQQTFLAYLLLHRDAPVSRQQLAVLFWPDTSDAQARTNLRNLIFHLREALPFIDEYIHADATCLEWRRETSFSLDVADFERGLAVTPGHALPRDALEQLIGTYTGDLFPDCYDDWIIPIRERLRLAYLSALEALATLDEEARDYPSALKHTLRLVSEDSLHPAANRQVIRLHALLGDRPEALRRYVAYARLLKQELGVDPDDETRELFKQLQLNGGAIPGEENKKPVPLVGRATEWSWLRSAWREAARGRSRLVLIDGEAGIGKTRLVEELLRWARLQGIQTAAAYCYPAEGNLPYAPVISWLKSQPLRRLDRVWLSEVARLMPEVCHDIPELPCPDPIHETWQRQHLFEALARALLVSQRPLLLVLEDIQWCDRDTLEWLHFTLRFASQAPLLVVATLRSGEISPDHPTATFQSALLSEDRCMELHLKPLSATETVELASQVLREAAQQPLSSDTAARIYQETEGNPLFVVELVRLEHIAGSSPGNGREELVDSGKVHAVLGRRIGQLSPAARELTALAAAIGREFNLDVLSQASGQPEPNIVASIDELLQRLIIKEISLYAYDFTHDLLRQAALHRLSTAHRRLLHRSVAEAIECLDQSAPHPRHAEIASHYEQAGLLRPAIQQYELASAAEARVFANVDALRHIERAVALAEVVGINEKAGISPASFAGMLEEQGDLLSLDGKYWQAKAYYERALDLPSSRAGVWRSQVYRKISDTFVPQHQYTLSYAALDQAERALPGPPSSYSQPERQEWLQIQLDRVQMYYWDNQPDQMESLIQKIRGEVETSGRLDQQFALLRHEGQYRMRRERYRLSANTLEITGRALALSAQLGDAYIRSIAQFNYGFSLLWHNDLSAAREELTKALEDTTRVGLRIWQVRALAYLSIVNRKLDEPEMVRKIDLQLLALSHEIGEYAYHAMGLADEGWLAWRAGDLALAAKYCATALEEWKAIASTIFHGLALWVLLDIAITQGDLAAAIQYAERLLDPDRYDQPLLEPMDSLLTQACLAWQAGDAGSAAQQIRQAIAAAIAAREL